jgi:hypothetical protein
LIIQYKKKYNISGTYKTMGYCKEEKGGMVKKRFEIICAEPAEVNARFVDI